MKRLVLLIKYYYEYIRFDKLSYKLLSLPASEQDSELLDEYIKTKDMYAELIQSLRTKKAQPASLGRAVAYTLCVLMLLLAGTGIAEAAGLHIWRMIFSKDARHYILQGTDDEMNTDSAEVVIVDNDKEAVTRMYLNPSQAHEVTGFTTGLGDEYKEGFSTSSVKVTYIDDMIFMDVTYTGDKVYYSVRVTVFRGDDDFLSGISISGDTYAEREIGGVQCSVSYADGITSCNFLTDDDNIRCLYSVKTNASQSELDEFVEWIVSRK